MPLNVIQLKEAIRQADIDAAGPGLDEAALARIDQKAGYLANAIADFIRGATVTVNTTVTVASGIPTVGSSPAGPTTGATVGVGTGTGQGQGTIT